MTVKVNTSTRPQAQAQKLEESVMIVEVSPQEWEIEEWRHTLGLTFTFYRDALQVLSGKAKNIPIPYKTALKEKLLWDSFFNSLSEKEKELFWSAIVEGVEWRKIQKQRKTWNRLVAKYVAVYGED